MMLHPVLWLAATVVSAPGLAADFAWSRYVSPELAFGVDYPLGWEATGPTSPEPGEVRRGLPGQVRRVAFSPAPGGATVRLEVALYEDVPALDLGTLMAVIGQDRAATGDLAPVVVDRVLRPDGVEAITERAESAGGRTYRAYFPAGRHRLYTVTLFSPPILPPDAATWFQRAADSLSSPGFNAPQAEDPVGEAPAQTEEELLGWAPVQNDGVRFSPDGQHMASWGGAQEGPVWLTVDGQSCGTYRMIGPGGSRETKGPPVLFSPDSSRLAFVARRPDGAFEVDLDANISPLWAEIRGLVFSPDSRRLAYVARPRYYDRLGQEQQGTWTIVVDDQPWPSCQPGSEVAALRFSPDSRRVAAVGYQREVSPGRIPIPKSSVQPQWLWAFLDGRPVLDRACNWICSLEFSPDGEHLAYATLNSLLQQWSIVVDGEESGPYLDGSGPIWSPTGNHLAYVACKSTEEGGRWVVVLDGQESREYDLIVDRDRDLSGNPNLDPAVPWPRGPRDTDLGKLFEARPPAVRVREADPYRVFSFAPDETMRALEGVAEYQCLAVFSPDGERLAYVAGAVGEEGVERFVVVDGEEGPPYAWVTTPVFSPDSARIAYPARKSFDAPKAWTVVIDGQAGADYDWVSPPRFSPDSRHVGYLAGDDGGPDRRPSTMVVLDGQPGVGYSTIPAGQPVFSAGGRHSAYVAEKSYGEWVVVVDGVERPAWTPGQPACPGPLELDPPRFSPDGERLAYVLHGRDGRLWAVVDGVIGPEFRQLGDNGVVFSPDSLHTAYVGRRANGEGALVVDQQEVAAKGSWAPAVYPDQGGVVPRLFIDDARFEADGAVTYFLARSNLLYRVRLRPPTPPRP